MKKLSVCLLAMLLVCLLAVNVSATDGKVRLIDDGGLLTDSEEKQISEALNKISNEFEYDVVIKTVETIGEYTSEARFAQNAFTSGGYGMGEEKSGVILVIFRSERRAYIEFFGEKRLPEGTALLEELVPALKNDNYASACLQFTDLVDGKLSFPWLRNIAIAAVIGIVVALIATGAMKGKLKSVRFRANAREYIRGGSFKLTRERDLYLYSTITRVPRPKSNGGGGVSRGGGSRGGGVSF